MSLLQVCQAVADDAGFGAPPLIVGSADDDATQLLALANKAGKLLARRPWSTLQKEYTFSTTDGTAAYPLPADYGWFTNDTAWDRTDYWAMRGSLSAQEWQLRKSGILSVSPRYRFRVMGAQLLIDPTPAAALSVVIEYVSNEWVSTASGSAAQFESDDDTTRFDEMLLQLELTWRFLSRKGLAYAEERDEAVRQIELAIARDVPASAVSFGRDRTPWPPLPSVPNTGFGP